MSVKYSIIIPTYNRVKILERCLQCICELENPDEDWEVLVLNNNSSDNTAEVVKSYKNRLPHLRYFHTSDMGLHVGRNLGLQKAEGDILCFIDDDSFVSKSWVEGIEKAFNSPNTLLVGGPCLPEYEEAPPKWLNKICRQNQDGRWLEYLSLIDFGVK